MTEVPNFPKIRDVDGDCLRAVEESIALHRSVGREPTPYLLQQKAEWEAKLGIKPEVRPVEAPEFEHAAELPLEEKAVPRRPGRPRKVVE